MPRLVIAILGHFFLFAWFRELGLWSGMEREAWKDFRIGSVAIIVLTYAGWVVIRGTQTEKIAGAVLCLLPALSLTSSLVSLWRTL
jgi:hypothetical protein